MTAMHHDVTYDEIYGYRVTVECAHCAGTGEGYGERSCSWCRGRGTERIDAGREIYACAECGERTDEAVCGMCREINEGEAA